MEKVSKISKIGDREHSRANWKNLYEVFFLNLKSFWIVNYWYWPMKNQRGDSILRFLKICSLALTGDVKIFLKFFESTSNCLSIKIFSLNLIYVPYSHNIASKWKYAKKVAPSTPLTLNFVLKLWKYINNVFYRNTDDAKMCWTYITLVCEYYLYILINCGEVVHQNVDF